MDYAPGLDTFLLATPLEESYAVERIEGVIPPSIRGTYYMNGPAQFQVGRQRYRNWLDGDGMVCSLRFDERGVWFTNKFVRGKKFCDEQQADAPIYATFGTRFQGDRMRRGIVTESPYNVSVLKFQDRLLAFGEQSIPMQLDANTLDTVGEFDFGRRVNSMSPFSAHPKSDAETGELFNFWHLLFSGSAMHQLLSIRI